MDYTKYNVENVLKKVEDYIKGGKKVRIWDVYEELSIFDWWKDYLSITNLKDMRKFLKEALKFGFKGYCCFKVGVSGCANGMWANEKETTDGYSPKDGKCLYKSFTPEENYWRIDLGNGFLPRSDKNHEGYDEIKTITDLERYYL